MFNSMFDELKEVKYCKEITDFKSLIMKNTRLLNCVPCVLKTCSRVKVSCVLTC